MDNAKHHDVVLTQVICQSCGRPRRVSYSSIDEDGLRIIVEVCEYCTQELTNNTGLSDTAMRSICTIVAAWTPFSAQDIYMAWLANKSIDAVLRGANYCQITGCNNLQTGIKNSRPAPTTSCGTHSEQGDQREL